MPKTEVKLRFQLVPRNPFARDESVVTWGFPDSGGDSSYVQDQLKGVQQVQATNFAFAAILAGGSVLPWGGTDLSGYLSPVIIDDVITLALGRF